MTSDVFEENPSGFDFADDPGNVGPQVPLVVFALALSRMAERLAGVSGKDGVDDASERPSVEGGNVIPDGCRGEVSCALCGDDCRAGVFFPFDKASGVGLRLCQLQSHIKATGARAK